MAERERGDLTVRSIGGLPHTQAKFLDGYVSVGSQHFGIEFGMVHEHLGDLCAGSLGARFLEVGLKVADRFGVQRSLR